MKRNTARLVFAALALLQTPFFSSLAPALDVPPLRGRVNDYAALLSPAKERELESRLAGFEQQTGHQIAVLTIPTLAGDALEDFSIRVAGTWKIGQQGFDNGAILLVVPNDRKLRIEVGYGLEGVLPDAIASRIIREVIVPHFRAEDYEGGVIAGVEAILKVAKGESLPLRSQAVKTRRNSSLSSSMSILMITAIIALFIGMTRRRLVSGAVGGGVAGFIAALFSAGEFGALLLVALVVGAILGAVGASMSVATSTYQWTGGSRYHRGGFFPGGFGTRGFGGGGFGGGGFSGGGGGFGGGGASGSW